MSRTLHSEYLIAGGGKSDILTRLKVTHCIEKLELFTLIHFIISYFRKCCREFRLAFFLNPWITLHERSLCVKQAQPEETATWRWWCGWLRSTRRRCGGTVSWLADYSTNDLIVTDLTSRSLPPSAGCGPKPALRWSWRPLSASAGSAIPPWRPSTHAKWNLLCWRAPSARPAFTSSSGSFSFSSHHDECAEGWRSRRPTFSSRELSVGRGSTATFGGGVMPAVHTVEPWDGKDGQVSGRVGPAERTVHYSSYLFSTKPPAVRLKSSRTMWTKSCAMNRRHRHKS